MNCQPAAPTRESLAGAAGWPKCSCPLILSGDLPAMNDPTKRDPEPPTVPHPPPLPNSPAIEPPTAPRRSSEAEANGVMPSSGELAKDLVRQIANSESLAGRMAEDEEDQILLDWLKLRPGGILGK